MLQRAMRQVLHVDMDAFFASVEQLDEPSLVGRPVLVGGDSPRGVVAAASYEARRYGVRSAMPMIEARRRCPQAIVRAPRRHRYEEVSHQVFAIFERFTPEVEGLSLDEAFLDVTGSRLLFGDGETIARAIKKAIADELGLTASAGVAPNKFVAKIASDFDKPDGLVIVREDEVAQWLAPLPIERMWGVGPKAAARLRAHGYKTLGELAKADRARLRALLGSWGEEVSSLARGEDDRPVRPFSRAKSLGSEETFERNLHSAAELRPHLLAQSANVAARLHEKELAAHVITTKIKYADHTTRTRQTHLHDPIADTDSIYETAHRLLDRFEHLGRGVRLCGVSASDLVPRTASRTLFKDSKTDRRLDLESTIQNLRAKLGNQAILRATLLDHPPDDDDHD